MKNKHIISETIFEGNKEAAKLAGYTPLAKIVDDVFACQSTVTYTCCNNQSIFIKNAELLKSRKKPLNNYISLSKIILDVYNCCEGTTLCTKGFDQWWISSSQIRPKKTIETIDFHKVIKKLFACCNVTDCNC